MPPLKPPPQAQLEAVAQILAQHRVIVPDDLLMAVVWATNQWVRTTGVVHLLDLLKLDIRNANDAFDFHHIPRRQRIPSKSIKELRGFLIDGQPVPPDEIQIDKKDVLSCENCGEPCPHAIEIDNHASKYTSTTCAVCSKLDDYARAKYEIYDCSACTYELCGHHSSNQRSRTG